MWSTRTAKILTFFSFISIALTAPSGFPKSGNGLWYTAPGSVWSLHSLPVGNGYLGAMLPGGSSLETTQLNIESLWSGGPLADPTYNGGNHQPSERKELAKDMQTIRQTIFDSPIGEIDNIEELALDAGAYGSYTGAGYLLSTVNATGSISEYGRYLDLDNAIAGTTWMQGGLTYKRETFCSHPSQACSQHLTTNKATSLPSLVYAFSPLIEAGEGLPTPNITCFDNSTLRVRGLASEPGMLYEILGKVRSAGGNPIITCASANNTFDSTSSNATIKVSGGASEAWITWVGGTNYDIDAGDAAHNFSFTGPDPHASLARLLSAATAPSKSYAISLSEHTADYISVATTPFSLSLGQTADLTTPTDKLKAAYQTDVGNTYLEWVLFNYGRYMLASSARGILPANLQGKWSDGYGSPWSGDYHANINLQMNYWSAEMSNLNVTAPLFDYMLKTWAPRGAETAEVLYNISRGWVTHDEMNIFGHTGMKAYLNSAEWANYPESAVWMMMHVYDHFDYTNDLGWWKSTGWPLIKGVASFHLDKLIPDLHFNDGTLVVNPCNSPEQVPITLGCAHQQQIIWQLFNAVEKGYAVSGDTDPAFLAEVQAKKAKMDKGIHIGSWGQLQEWKVEKDQRNDTHRHLSHLIGLYPGYALTNYNVSLQGGQVVNSSHLNYTISQVLHAADISLFHRGNGTGLDADSGWEKAWRAACWAQLGNASEFYHILSYAIERNFGPNLFSLYNPFADDPIFQIDANLGYPGAVLNALLQAPDVPTLATPLIIKLLPALPASWPSGELRGARIRGGLTLDLKWNKGKATSATIQVDKNVRPRAVQVIYGGRIVHTFTTSAGSSISVM